MAKRGTGALHGSGEQAAPEVRLRACDLRHCKARCCYDGAYLDEGEERKITDIVSSAPDFFDGLPTEFIVEGHWNGRPDGRKTAVRADDPKEPGYPGHFTPTRCVFCADDYRCTLQVLALQRGLHKWAYKPRSCWLFPLREVGGHLQPPPAAHEPDPHDLGAEYPGFAKHVPCGQDRVDGESWRQCLAEELKYWKQQRDSKR